MAALPQELGNLRDQLQQPSVREWAHRSYCEGQLGSLTVITTTARIGKVAAASTATTLIQQFNAEAIVFVGVAGGIGSQVQVGDVVLAQELMQHDLSAAPLFPALEIPLLGLQRIPTDANLTGLLRTAATQAISAWKTQTPHTLVSRSELHEGLILSGDQFIHQAGHAEQLLLATPDALAVEMEGAAVAQVCWENEIPFAVIRTISDRADRAAPVDFEAFLNEVAAPMSSAILLRLLSVLA